MLFFLCKKKGVNQIVSLKKYEDENLYKYIWRIDGYIQEGRFKNWSSVVFEVNKELFGDDIEKYRDESSYRKPCADVRNFIKNGVFSPDDEYLKTLKEQCREIERQRICLRDETREWNKQNRLDARYEQKLNYLEDQLMTIGKVNFPNHDKNKIKSEQDMIVMLSDLHGGQTFSSSFGEYNTDILKERMKKYLNKIVNLQNIHKTKNCYVIGLGDLISGNIHKNLSVTNRENVIEQIKIVSELISSFCYDLTFYFESVFFVEINGNHSRIERKDEAHHDERLDSLIGFIVEKTLNSVENFHSLQHRKLDSGIGELNIRGKTYIAVHGDFDPMSKSGVSNLCMMLGFIPDTILRGHHHYPAFMDISGVKIVQSGSMAGSGDYHTIEKRLTGKPSQTILICSENGIEGHYPVYL